MYLRQWRPWQNTANKSNLALIFWRANISTALMICVALISLISLLMFISGTFCWKPVWVTQTRWTGKRYDRMLFQCFSHTFRQFGFESCQQNAARQSARRNSCVRKETACCHRCRHQVQNVQCAQCLKGEPNIRPIHNILVIRSWIWIVCYQCFCGLFQWIFDFKYVIWGLSMYCTEHGYCIQVIWNGC